MAAPKQILVPIDYSVHSAAAVRFGRDLATAFGAKLHFVHVFPSAAMVGTPLTPSPVITGDVRAACQRGFDDFLETARRDLGVPSLGTLREGNPHTEILSVAEEI